MSYEDASQAGSMDTGSAPTARADVDALPAGSFGPANGNVITGAGTTSGASGADSVADAPAKIVEVHGAGGPTASAANGFQATGQFGVLNMDAQGNFNYVRNAGTPDGAQDVFGYTLADRDGSTSSTTLTIDIGRVNDALAQAAQGIVNLPPGVELSDIKVNGRDLIIQMPDGTQMVIPGGAVFVPQLVIGDVEVPASNLAALLVDNEPKPAAGTQQSSGGNFAADVPPLDPGVPLGDLIPPTELSYTPPEYEEIGQGEDDEPEIIIIPDGQPGAVNAVDSVDEAGLPARGGEPEGSGEEAAAGADGDPSEHTSGVISIDTGNDDIESVTINGVEINAVGDEVVGEQGTLRITSINFDTGQIGYIYTLNDNTNPGGDNISDFFEIIVTDDDGDTATGSLTIDIIDDTPIARDDTDAVNEGASSTDGNVLTGANTTSGAAGHDTSGADGLHGETNGSIDGVTAVQAGTSTTFDGADAVAQNGTGKVVDGTFGTLTIHNDGSYSYVLHQDVGEGGTDVFTYQITDGDGDTDTATLTITVPGNPNEPPIVAAGDEHVSEEGLVPNGIADDAGSPDTTNSPTASGDVIVNDPDGDATTASLGEPTQTLYSDGTEIEWTVSDGGHTLTGSAGGNDIIVVTIDDNGEYEVTLKGPVDHPDDTIEDAVDFTIPVTVSDGTVDVPTSIKVTIEDDSPANLVVRGEVEFDVTLDESGPGGSATIAINDGTTSYVAGNDGDVAGSGPIATGTSGLAAVVTSVAFGADGPQGATGLSYELSILNSDSGLQTTEGVDINLVQLDTGEVLGIVEGTDTVAFAISIDSDGKVTVEQYLSLFHDGPTVSDEPVSFGEGVLGVIVTATDNDGDHISSDAVDVGEHISFLDDEPTNVQGDLNPDFDVTLDESGPGGTALIAINDGSSSYVAGDDGDVDGDGPIAIGTSSVSAIVDADADFGADGPAAEDSLTYQLSILSEGGASGLTTTEGDDINLVQLETGEVLGIVEGTNIVAFAISIDPDSGEVRVEQYLSLFHDGPTVTDEPVSFEDGVLGVTITATDGDGDQITSDAVDIGEHVSFLDDEPTDVDGEVNPDFDVTLDESGPGVAATIAINDGSSSYVAGNDPDVTGSGPIAGSTSAAGVIVDPSAAFGADGPAADPEFTYGLSILAVDGDSGLTTTEGTKINLVQLETGEVLGIVDGTDTVAFAVSIDPDTGKVTVEQYLSLFHDGPTVTDEPVSFDTGVLGVVVTATDGDGDQVNSDAVDIGPEISFLDDEPSNVSGEVDADFEVVLDESGPGGAATIAINDAHTSYVAGNDPDVTGSGPIAVGTSSVGVITGADADFGADGAAAEDSLTYDLTILAEGGDSGLTTTEGDAINLVQLETGEILGIVDGTDTVAFAIAIDHDSGEVTVEQYLSLFHDGPTQTDEPVSFGEGILGVTITATDGDGDQVTGDAIDIGENISFLDDEPAAGTPSGTPPTLTLDESPLPADGGDGIRTVSSTTIVNLFGTAAYGADGADGDPAYSLLLTPDSEGGEIGSGLYALDNTDTDDGTGLGSDGDGYGQGEEIILVQIDANTIEGQDSGGHTYFTIEVDPTTGEVTFSQQDNIWHDDMTDSDDGETLTASGGTLEIVQTITDGDGDTDTASIDLSDGIFNIEDDGPSDIEPEAANVEQGGSVTKSLDLIGPDGDAAGVDDNYGTDGPGTVRFPSSLEGTAALDADGDPLTSGGAAITYHLVDGQHLQGVLADDTVVFDITLDPGSSEYTVTLNEQIDSFSHVDFNDGNYDFVGGNDPWGGFTSSDNDSQDLLVTPMIDGVSDGTFNSSSISGGVGDGNSVSPDEGIRLDYVIDLTGNPAKAGGSGDYSDAVNQDQHFEEHYNTNGASADFTATTGSTVHIEAFDDDADGSNGDNTFVVGDGSPDAITAIAISYDGGDPVLIDAVIDGDGTYTVNDGLPNERSYTVTFNVDGTVDVEDVVGTSGAGAVPTTIAVFTGDGYNSLEFTNIGGDAFKIGNFGASVQSEDPVPFNVPVEIVDADGDTATGELPITVYAVGDLPTETLTTFASTSSFVENSLDTSSLYGSNDNHQLKNAFKGGSDAVLTGALAAAGLSAGSQAAAQDFAATSGLADTSDQGSKAKLSGEIKASVDSHREGFLGPQQQSDDPKHAESSSSSSNDRAADTSLTDANDSSTAPTTELLQGTDAPASDGAAHSAITSQAIYMPTAEMLAAHGGKGVDAKGGDAQSSDADVGKVLADALHGGGQGPDIEALVNALGGQGGEGGKAALEALASHGHGAVPNGDTGVFAGFTGSHGLPSMEHMTMHQDAAPQHG